MIKSEKEDEREIKRLRDILFPKSNKPKLNVSMPMQDIINVDESQTRRQGKEEHLRKNIKANK